MLLGSGQFFWLMLPFGCSTDLYSCSSIPFRISRSITRMCAMLPAQQDRMQVRSSRRLAGHGAAWRIGRTIESARCPPGFAPMRPCRISDPAHGQRAPAEYDGGELLVEDTYGVHSVKLPAGDLVVYPATSLHKVAPVTRGARIACFSGSRASFGTTRSGRCCSISTTRSRGSMLRMPTRLRARISPVATTTFCGCGPMCDPCSRRSDSA